MKKPFNIIAVILAVAVLLGSWPAYNVYGELKKARSEDPLVWLEDVAALESTSAGQYGPAEAIVFIGSSSIRFWETLAEDMSPMQVVQHGFGGAKLNDIVYYADRLVNAYQPRAVVVFAGTNDIDLSASKSPEVLLASYQTFIKRITAGRLDLPVFYIGITPSPLRWDVWPVAQQTNALIQQWTEEYDNLYFIDTGPALLGPQGQPNRDNYRIDGLHLSAKGYARWTDIIKARLQQQLDDS